MRLTSLSLPYKNIWRSKLDCKKIIKYDQRSEIMDLD